MGNSNGHAAVSAEIQNIIADIEHLLGTAAGVSAEDLKRLKTLLGQRVAAARESAEKVGGAAVVGAIRTATRADDYVHHQPWQAIGIGVASGFLLGVLVSALRSSEPAGHA